MSAAEPRLVAGGALPEAPEEAPQPLMFEVDTPEQAAERLRQVLGLLGRLSLAPAPLYYSLLYNHIAGRSERLSQELEACLKDPGGLTHDDAVNLFQRHLGEAGEALIEDIRKELVTLVAQVIGALVDVAGKTAMANEEIGHQVDVLAQAKRPSDALAAANEILRRTRRFVTDSQALESELQSSVAEMDKLKRELSDARREATIDSLTGLFNRRAFDERLVDLVRHHAGLEDGFCLLLLDIDNFKRINDTYGHMVGDKVLSEFAKQLGKLTRRSDFVARYGGEEFAILLPYTRITSAFTVAENVRGTLERVRLRRSASGESLGSVTVSIGVACSRDGEDSESLLARCDAALYRAKRIGRNRTVLAD